MLLGSLFHKPAKAHTLNPTRNQNMNCLQRVVG
jgi:hypothetical protein